MLEENAEVLFGDYKYALTRKSMLGGNRYVDEGKCMDYILTLKSMLPQDIKEAQIIVKEKENIMKEAEDYAAELISDAKYKANKILDESKLIATAKYRQLKF